MITRKLKNPVEFGLLQYLRSLEQLLDLAPFLAEPKDLNQIGLESFQRRVITLRTTIESEEGYNNEG